MKYLITLTAILFINVLMAQEFPLEQRHFINENNLESAYFKDINGHLDKFLGVWKYDDGITSFEIQILKNTKEYLQYYQTDQIYVKFKLMQNGTVIYDYLNSTDENLKIWISGSLDGNSLNKCEMLYLEPTDIPYNRSNEPRLLLTHSMNLSFPGGTTTAQETIQWNLEYGKQRDSDPWPFKIPSQMTLVKQ